MAAQVAQGSPLAQQLQNIVQPKLVEAGWSSDDTTLSEYVVLMLANGKDKEQVANELASDLLNLEDGDTSAAEFSEWLFSQLAVLTGQAPMDGASQAQSDSQPAPIQVVSTSTDTDIGGMDVESTSVPTGPKSMRNGSGAGRRGNDRGNPMNRALNRANDSLLHKVRNNSTERIGRGPPRGPRGGLHGAQFTGTAGAGRGGPRQQQQQISQQQQNQLMQFMSQQMEMMQQVLTGQNPQAVMNGMNGMNGAAINPHFRGRPANERGGRGGGKAGGDRKQHHHNSSQAPQQSGDTEMTGEGMDTDSNGAQTRQDPANTVCKFDLKCTKVDCHFAHHSPANDSGAAIDFNDVCSFGASCTNKKCVGKHPSPSQRTAFHKGQECRFWPNCTNPKCPFKHPEMPMCKFGGDCNRDDCKFTHVRTLCKYNPCMNPRCHFKHNEGQKKNPTWTKDSEGDAKMGTEHVSERKFTSEDGGEEEFIKPEPAQEDTEVEVAA